MELGKKTTDPKLIWKAVLGKLQLQVTKSSFDTWLSSTSGHKLEGNSLIISVPNNFVAEMLDQRMYSIISLAVEQVLGRTTDIKFSVIVSDINSEKPIYNNHHPDETVSKVNNKPAF